MQMRSKRLREGTFWLLIPYFRTAWSTPAQLLVDICNNSRAMQLRGLSSTSRVREYETQLCHSEGLWENETQLSLLLNGGNDPNSFLDPEAHLPHPCWSGSLRNGNIPALCLSCPDPPASFPPHAVPSTWNTFPPSTPPHSRLQFKYCLCWEAFSDLMLLHGAYHSQPENTTQP